MFSSFVDFHCHPSLKPYGKSFNSDKVNSLSRKDKNSIWHYDPPNFFERGLQMLAGICKFTQADFTTLAYGNAQIICASLYPMERGFFRNGLGTGTVPGDLLDNFVTCVGKKRVDFIQDIRNYFDDIQNEYAFYKQLAGKKIRTDAGEFSYKLVRNFTDLANDIAGNPEAEKTIYVILSIEGLHVLNSDIDSGPDETSILNNLNTIKHWDHPPFFVTVAHHFYNHICGHAKSLIGMIGGIADQSVGINTGFTPLGKQVIQKLLSKNDTEKRVYVDIKHMSAIARKEYFMMLEQEFADEQIPVIVSHGAANGLRSMDQPVEDFKETSPKLLAEDINFYDDEILMVAKTKGIFGLQLDERRIASKSTLKNTKHAIPLNKIRHYRAELLWNQIQHIVEVIDSHDLFAWDCLAIGSDFDGIINPLNGFLTAETLHNLQEYTERYAFNYMNGRGKLVLKSYNQISASEIVNRIFTDNGMAFIQKWF